MGVVNDQEEISRLFDSLDIGRVSYVKFYPKIDKIGKSYNSANIYFSEWYDTDTARALQMRIQNATREKPVRMIYSDPLDWILLENRQANMEAKQQTEAKQTEAKETVVKQHTEGKGGKGKVYESFHNRPNDFEDEYELHSVPLVRQKTPLINSYTVPQQDYLEVYHRANSLERELDDARHDNESLYQDIKIMIDEIDEQYNIDLLLQQQEIDQLRRRIYELEDRNRHLESVSSHVESV